MTVPADIPAALLDLRAVRLDEMPLLSPAALDQVVRRVLPVTATAPAAPVPGTAFGSSI